MNKERHKPIGIEGYLLIAWMLFLYMFAGYYALYLRNQPLFANVEMTVPQDFHSRLRKHGLDKQFSAIELSEGKLYFYRDGKKINF